MKSLIILLLTFFVVFASETNTYYHEEDGHSANCLILKDENSIVCKYILPREFEEKDVIFEWTDPNGDTTRRREINIPAGHGSAYDFRFIEGRVKGVWTFRVIDGDNEYTTNFELK